MPLRAFLNRHPVATVGVVVVLIALAVVSIVYQLRPPSDVALGPRKDFYTVDDGETWFVDDIDKITPFDHDGKPAVLVHLFTCDGGKARFVGYLEKLPDGAVEKYRARMNFPASATPEADDVAEMVGSLVKRKGEMEWVASIDRERFEQITQVHCPGGTGEPERVRAE